MFKIMCLKCGSEIKLAEYNDNCEEQENDKIKVSVTCYETIDISCKICGNKKGE